MPCKDGSHYSQGRGECLSVLVLSAKSELFFRYRLIFCIINEILVQRLVPKSDRPSMSCSSWYIFTPSLCERILSSSPVLFTCTHHRTCPKKPINERTTLKANPSRCFSSLVPFCWKSQSQNHVISCICNFRTVRVLHSDLANEPLLGQVLSVSSKLIRAEVEKQISGIIGFISAQIFTSAIFR